MCDRDYNEGTRESLDFFRGLLFAAAVTVLGALVCWAIWRRVTA